MERSQLSPIPAENRHHFIIHVGSVVLAFVALVISNLFYSLAKDSAVPNGLFQYSSRNVSETFPLDVTMDWWSDVWTGLMIDFWALLWFLYALLGLSKRNVLGPQSCNPEIHPPVFYLMWTLIHISRMCSMYLWDRHNITGAVILTWTLTVLSFCMLYISYFNLTKYKAWLAINNPQVIPWTRYLVQNGLAVFAWWSLLNAVVGLGIVFKYIGGVPDPLVSTIVLTVISLCTVIWFLLQTFLLNKYLRYTFSVYAILILGLGSMFTRSYRVNDIAPNTIYCGFLMLLITIMSFFHLICECLHTDKPSSPPPAEPRQTFEGCVTMWTADHIKHKLQK